MISWKKRDLKTFLTLTGLCALVLFGTHRVNADAIVRTQAMFADTIAEIFIEDDEVTVNLEIGLADLRAFRNLLPDEIFEDMGYEPEPLQKRLAYFFARDFIILGKDGDPLRGRIVEMGPRDRIKRDDITGEELPADEAEPETVVHAQIKYPVTGKPDELAFGVGGNAQRASIGFVAYHKGIAVNDFRYLGNRQFLELDWKDPWYSKFEAKALRRTNFAPMSGFIYVEPYEVRKEIIARPKDLQSWIDLGLADRETIPVAMQAELKRKAGEFLRQHHAVVIDGETIEPDLARINFLERTLKTSRVIEPPIELDVNSAMLGVIFVYPTKEALPQRVTMDWDLFNDRIQLIPVSAVDQAGPLPSFLEPDFTVLEWQNFLKFPELPTLKALIPPPSTLEIAVKYLRWLFLAGVLWLSWQLVRQIHHRRGSYIGPAMGISIMVAITTGAFWINWAARLSDEKAAEIIAGLLHNVYRAFDFREEGQIYDVLENSVEGDLLSQIYLETLRSLELANQGGARAKVNDIRVIEFKTESGEDGGFIATTTWNVGGSVGHWGHVHQRQNQYQAVLDIRPIDGNWKLIDLEVLEEQRL